MAGFDDWIGGWMVISQGPSGDKRSGDQRAAELRGALQGHLMRAEKLLADSEQAHLLRQRQQ
eukprot:450143-Pyramimonas_sp.AAC.1